MAIVVQPSSGCHLRYLPLLPDTPFKEEVLIRLPILPVRLGLHQLWHVCRSAAQAL